MYMKSKKDIWKDYEVEGQISIADYISEFDKIRDVDVRGLCDDAYCPRCNRFLDDLEVKDCERCPYCNQRINWDRWRKMNDEDEV